MHSRLHSGLRPSGLLYKLKAVFPLILFASAPQSLRGVFVCLHNGVAFRVVIKTLRKM